MGAVGITLLSLAILIVGFLAGWLVAGMATTFSNLSLLALPMTVIGFLIGWLAEWMIDNQCRRLREMASAAAAAGPGVGGELGRLSDTIQNMLTDYQGRDAGLQAAWVQQEGRYEELRSSFEYYAATHPDDLTVIRGIGPAYQWKLRDAGYGTYARLAEADADDLRAALGIKSWQRTDPQSWIDQARQLIDHS